MQRGLPSASTGHLEAAGPRGRGSRKLPAPAARDHIEPLHATDTGRASEYGEVAAIPGELVKFLTGVFSGDIPPDSRSGARCAMSARIEEEFGQ
jgi:hypothetical protein